MIKIITFLLLCLPYFTKEILVAQFRYDPRLKWSTLETANCYIHYHQAEDSLAKIVAQKAENFYQQLTEIFHYAPRNKVHVVLDNSSDILLDAATPFPHLTVFLNPTTISVGLGHYEDWFDLVIAHEFTHAIDIDKTGGISKLLRSLIGRLYFPGILGPQWLTEGLATYFETELTEGGRGIDPYHDMILRAAFLEHRVPTPDQLSTYLVQWPGANSSYVFGESFYRYIAQRFGTEALINFRNYYISNFFPFRVNEALQSATGYGLNYLYAEWMNSMSQRFMAQADSIQKIGLTQSQQVTRIGYENWSPEWSSDGNNIFFVSSHPDRHTDLRTVAVTTNQHRKIEPANIFETQISYSSHGNNESIFFSKIEFERSYSLRNEIWQLDIHSGKLRGITRGQRARHPVVHPSGQKIAFITSNLGQTDLWEYDLIQKKQTLLIKGGLNRLFFNPAWSPDGKKLALSIWEKGGSLNIWIFDSENHSLKPLLHDKAWDVNPCWSDDGRYILFSSDRSGVYNIFAYDLETHQLQQITNVLGGAFDPAISPDNSQVAFVSYSADGFDIHVMDWDKQQPISNYKIILGEAVAQQPGFVYGYTEKKSLAAQPQIADSSLSPAKSYNPLKMLSPRFIIPIPTADEKGMALTAFTYGQDVIGKHAYLMGLSYGLNSNRLGYLINYANSSFYPDLNFLISDFVLPRDNAKSPADKSIYWERRRELAAEIQIPIYKIDNVHLVSGGIHFRQFTPVAPLPLSIKPAYFEGKLNNVRMAYLFSNAHRFPRSINPVEGMNLSASIEHYDRKLGSKINFSQALAAIDKYFRMPALPRHIIQLSGMAGVNDLTVEKNVENMAEAVIRGFKPFTWRKELYQATIEHQFPLSEIERATPLLPIFLRRVHGSIFSDLARFRDIEGYQKTLRTAGLELRLDMALGYLLPARLRLGYAIPLQAAEKPGIFIYFEYGL